MKLKTVLATLAVLSLASCGGGGGDPTPPRPEERTTSRLVVFGDSLSDGGTYTRGAQQLLATQVNPAFAAAGVGKFVDGPGLVWPEVLAARLGITITNERFEWGPGNPLAATDALQTGADATNYAQGGARVASQPGVGCGTVVNDKCTFVSTVPGAQQIDRALAKGNFQSTDIVFFWFGTNDVFFYRTLALTEIDTRVAAATTALGRAPTDAEIAVIRDEVKAAFVPRLEEAATQAIAQLKRLQAAGASRLIGMTIPNSAKTPFGVTNVRGQRPLLDAFSVAFNNRLKAAFAAEFPDNSRALLYDAGRFADVLYDDPAAVGLPNRDVPVCSVPPTLGTSAFFCFKGLGDPFINPAVNPATSMFSDGVHPTVVVHAKLATALYDELKDRNWVK